MRIYNPNQKICKATIHKRFKTKVNSLKDVVNDLRLKYVILVNRFGNKHPQV